MIHRLSGLAQLLVGLMVFLAVAAGTSAPGWAQQEGNTCDVQGENRDCPNGILANANLSGADLSGANLSGTDLSGANLTGADLSGANLEGGNLQNAELYGANLAGARLTKATLVGANLLDATFAGATFGQTVCPDGHLTDGPAC